MSRRGLLFADGFFPFPISRDDVEEWDGSTFYNGAPSNASDKTTRVVGPFTHRPVGFTLEELSRIFWRVKHWKITADFTVKEMGLVEDGEIEPGVPNFEWDVAFTYPFNVTFDGGDIDPGRDSGDGTIDAKYKYEHTTISATAPSTIDQIYLEGKISGESYLCTGANSRLFSLSLDVGLSVAVVFEIFFQSLPTYYLNDLYYPYLVIQTAQQNGITSAYSFKDGETSQIATTTSGNPDAIADYTEASSAVTFFGHSVPIRWPDGEWVKIDTEDQFMVFSPNAISIEPSKFWSYGGIYDEDTGAPV
jgi:hypothetical protein